MALNRWCIRFESIYDASAVYVYIMGKEFSEQVAWAALMDEKDDVIYSVDYARMFWRISDVEKNSLCDGCRDSILNQLGHMDRNGCLSEEHDSLEDVEAYNLALLSRTNFSNCPILS